MNRAQKETFVDEFTKGIEKSKAFALMSFSKVKVEEVTEFRKSLLEKNIRVRVVKNTLAKRVFDKTPYKSLGENLAGPTLIAYDDSENADAVSTVKSIWEWAEKKEFNVEVKSGAALGEVMSLDKLKALSKLPGKKELMVSFLFALKHHPTNFLYALKDAPQRLGYAFNALKDKKEQSG